MEAQSASETTMATPDNNETSSDKNNTNKNNNNKLFKCPECTKVFSKRYNVHRHLNKMHGIEKTTEKSAVSIECGYQGCSVYSRTVDELRLHLVNEHGIESKTEERIFDNEEAFLKWKGNLELEERVNYTQMSGSKNREDKVVKYFYCNRSGKYNSRTTGKRKCVHRTTCKIQKHCTATLKMVHDKSDGRYHVWRCASHFNHEIELKHLRLSTVTKLNIAEQLQQGVDPDTILCKAQNGFCGTSNRDKLLTVKDIQNIKRSFRSQVAKRYKDDSNSLKLFINNLLQFGVENPVLGYKLNSEETNIVTKCDFFVAICHPIQINLLKLFASKFICIDVIEKTNSYDFSLLAVLILDEAGEVLPVAWLLVDKLNSDTLSEFFNLLRLKVGDIRTETVMCDTSEIYYEGWCKVFGNTPRNLMLPHCFTNSWQKSLHLIENENVQAVVYNQFQGLLTCENEVTFTNTLKCVSEELLNNDLTHQFGCWFNDNFVSKSQQWAYCFRKELGENLQTSISNFRDTIRQRYLENAQEIRLDKLLQILLKIVRDNYFTRLVISRNGNVTQETQTIQTHHRQSFQMDTKSVQKVTDDNIYYVKLQNVEHRVQITAEKCFCQLQCTFCDVCVHNSTCTCRDGVVRGLICEHIHLTVRYINQCKANEMSPLKKLKRSLPKSKEDVQLLLTEINNAVTACTNQQVINELETMLTNCRDFIRTVPAQEFVTNKDKEDVEKLQILTEEINNITPLKVMTVSVPSVADKLTTDQYVMQTTVPYTMEYAVYE